MNIFLPIIAFSSLAFIIGLMVGAAMASAKNADLQDGLTHSQVMYELARDREKSLMEKHADLEREAKKLERKVNEYELKQRPDRRFS